MTEVAEGADLLASRDPEGGARPFITLAIPQYKRRHFLEVNIQHAIVQDSKDFEILVSDDCSPDDTNQVIPPMLEKSGIPFRYFAQRKNLGYDKNVRFCLKHARGRYVFMLGNDDAVASPDVMRRLQEILTELDYPELCVTNYRDWHTGGVTRRSFGNKIFGSGPAAAAHYFRSFSFTSGLIYDREAAAKHETDKWDQSIYYQIWLACRILATGGRLAGADVVAILDHIRLDGKLVPETYRVRYAKAPLSFKHKHTGLDSVARVAVDAIAPYVSPAEKSALTRRIYQQLLTITYPFWLFEYREIANWGMAWGIARDLWPAHQLAEYELRRRDEAYLWLLYLGVTSVGLAFPAKVFNRVRGGIAGFVRRARQRHITS